MKDRTHDISLIDYHVKDVETFGKEDDDLGVVKEIDDLEAVFRDVYGYRVGRWKIPSTTSHNSLVYRIVEVLRDFESNDKLFITYYGGHGFMNDDRECVWLSNQRPGAATLQWSSIQTMLEQAECDVLILLDCCAAASSGGSHGKGVTELIAACGFEAFAPGVGEHSFTRSLIDELEYLNQRGNAITTAILHSEVLGRIKNSWNPRYSTDGTEERRKTPIYIHLSDDENQRCIKLAPLRQLTATTPSHLLMPTQPSLSSSPSSSASEDVDMIDSEGTSQTSLSEVWPDKKFRLPKVLISVALQEDQRLNTHGWLEWLKSVPALANLVQVEGVFKSDSTLLILTLPVALWDLTPKDPAVTFLAFVRSHNLRNRSYQPLNYGSLNTVGSKPNIQRHNPFNVPYSPPLLPRPSKITYDSIKSPGHTPRIYSPAPTAFSSSTEGKDMMHLRSKTSLGSGYSWYASGLHSYQLPEHDSPRPLGSWGPDYYSYPLGPLGPEPYSVPTDSRGFPLSSPILPQAGAAVEKSLQKPR
ncbi:MAG: hypothetical protein Q9199_006946 [Rusavskia elegans]